MKCIKCGFESNSSFCPMCGTKFPEEVNTTHENSPQFGVISSEDGPTAYYTEFNPYQQTNQGAPIPPQNIPTPHQYAPYEPEMPQSQKSGKALPIILSIIVSIVIIVGAVMNIISPLLFDVGYIVEHYDNSDDSFYDDFQTDEDPTIHSINEPIEFKYGIVTFKGIEITKDKFEFDENCKEFKLTFEFENPTDEIIELAVPTVQFCPADGDYYEDCFEWLYDDYETPDNEYSEFTLGAKEKKTFVTYYKVPNDVKDFNISLDQYDLDYSYNFICYFEASLTQAETITQKEN